MISPQKIQNSCSGWGKVLLFVFCRPSLFRVYLNIDSKTCVRNLRNRTSAVRQKEPISQRIGTAVQYQKVHRIFVFCVCVCVCVSRVPRELLRENDAPNKSEGFQFHRNDRAPQHRSVPTTRGFYPFFFLRCLEFLNTTACYYLCFVPLPAHESVTASAKYFSISV